ncbi:MAG: metallophosphoesterase family protein [Myxococcales bacterium]|nr:metallophosphoesterase family protein [Myxococcales bacterium]MCB9578955.1 metallophosphoesterase family protein [Polyangiaceae bacterium]
MKRAWFLGLSLALGACSDDNSVSPKTTVDAGTTMDAGSDATTDGGCPGNGVSKRPWALHVDGTSALLRWEACRPGAASSVTLTPESSGSTLEFESTETEFVVNNTYRSLLNPDAPPDEAGTYYMHEAQLTGLAPSTCYHYEVATAPEHDGRLCTARAPGETFSFLATADTNPGLSTTVADLFGVIQGEDYDFTVHGGDIQYYASGLETWAYWFPAMAPMLRHGAFLPSIGNHENEKPDEYQQYFARFFGNAGFDGTDGYYRFSSGGVWFFTLDTETSLDASSPQVGWFKQQIADAAASPGYRFSIVYFHKPFLTCGDTGDNVAARNVFEPLFEQYGVSLILQGHMHGYERFEVPSSEPGKTLTYLTIAGGGGLLGDVDKNIDRPECAMRVASGKFYHFALFDVTKTGISARIVDRDGKLQDQFEKALP